LVPVDGVIQQRLREAVALAEVRELGLERRARGSPADLCDLPYAPRARMAGEAVKHVLQLFGREPVVEAQDVERAFQLLVGQAGRHVEEGARGAGDTEAGV